MTEHSAPLLGDKDGKYRILILGNGGAGKVTSPASRLAPLIYIIIIIQSTLSATLAKKFNITHCSLDQLFWKPGWQQTPASEFRALIQDEIDRNPQGWIIDGNYAAQVGTMIQDQATDIIWLDPPLALYFPRVFVRTIKRWWGLQELCSPGCGETFKDIFLSKKSILVFCLSMHFEVRRRCGEMMSRIGIGIGPDPKSNVMRRIGGWGGELKSWLREVDIMVRKK